VRRSASGGYRRREHVQRLVLKSFPHIAYRQDAENSEAGKI
jgi:hypothetical protein